MRDRRSNEQEQQDGKESAHGVVSHCSYHATARLILGEVLAPWPPPSACPLAGTADDPPELLRETPLARTTCDVPTVTSAISSRRSSERRGRRGDTREFE